MASRSWFCGALICLATLGGCIVSDQLTTFTLQPDGSADLVVFHSNLRSTEQGDRAERELNDYRAKFDAGQQEDVVRVRAAGGRVVDASWIRQQPPMSYYVRALLPDAAALERFLTIRQEDGSPLIATRFHSEGSRRRLTVRVTMPANQQETQPPVAPDVKQIKQALADGISETRIAVVNGSITEARGFIVAGDKRSALLNDQEISDLLRQGEGTTELYLEWDVVP
jgi:hypothetical protein